MKDTNSYKRILEEQKVKLLKEMSSIGRENPNAPGEWEAVETDLDADSADENEVADEIEEFGENSAILEKFEAELKQVNRALEKIEEGTYGKCDIGDEEIPEERLKINPSATTCVEHSK